MDFSDSALRYNAEFISTDSVWCNKKIINSYSDNYESLNYQT